MPEAREALQAQIPLGRSGQPEDVAGAVGSDNGAFVTDAVIDVNGGSVM